MPSYLEINRKYKGDNMKKIIISSDGDSIVYLVPDDVADNLKRYCIEFCDRWMKTSPYAKEYRIKGGFCYTEADFIKYLNKYIFPEQKSVFVKNLGWTDLGKNLPDKYKDYPYFNF